jgi:hypothetical protein
MPTLRVLDVYAWVIAAIWNVALHTYLHILAAWLTSRQIYGRTSVRGVLMP